MKIALIVMAVVIGVLVVYAAIGVCIGRYFNQGEVVTLQRKTAGVDSIDFRSVGKIVIIQSDQEGVEIETKQKYTDRVMSRAEGATLKLHEQDDVLYNLYAWALPKPTYYVSVHNLASLSTSGMGDIELKKMKTPSLTIRAMGLGSFKADVEVTGELKAIVSGSLKVMLTGVAGSQAIETSGSGSYDALGLRVQTATVQAGGNSKLALFVEKTLKVTLKGSSHVSYKGSPRITQDTSGTGKLTALE